MVISIQVVGNRQSNPVLAEGGPKFDYRVPSFYQTFEMS